MGTRCATFIPVKLYLITLSLACSLLVANCSEEKKQAEQIPVPMPAEAAQGKEIYIAQNCNGCHGETGHGDGPAGQALNPKPRNYRDIYAYRKGNSLDQIAAMLEFGLEGSPMKGYPHLTLEKRKLLAAYVVWLQKQP